MAPLRRMHEIDKCLLNQNKDKMFSSQRMTFYNIFIITKIN